MIHVVLTILKILGIILLVLILLVLLLLSAVLFVPVRYTVKADHLGKPHADIRAAWLLKLLRFRVLYDEQGFRYRLKILCFSIMDSEAKESPPKHKKQKHDKNGGGKKKHLKDKSGSDLEPEDGERVSWEDTGLGRDGSSEDGCGFGRGGSEDAALQDPERDSDGEDGNPVSRSVRKIRDGIKNAYYKTAEFKEKVRNKLEQLSDLINDEANREFVVFMKGQIGEVLSHIAPRRYRIKVKFGADSPDVTGKVTGAAAVLTAYLKRDTKKRRGTFEYIPVFEEKILEADIFMKGRIRISSLLVIAWRVYRNERFKKLVLKK